MNKKNEAKFLGKGNWITIGSPIITELISHFPFDWLLFDMEHGYLTEGALLPNLQAVWGEKIRKIVRVPSLNPALIARVLDRGASGIMLPHVSTSAQARACIDAMRYPPLGNRGYSGQARSFNYGLNTPADVLKINSPYFLAQIEDYEGVLNAETIAQTEGVNVLFIGPSDLKLDLSTRKGPTFEYYEAIKTVADAANKYQKQAGILIKNVEDIPEYSQLGYSCLAVESDLGILRKSYQLLTGKFKDL
jgi:2-keto-3-deoxy-L-rhamnonate aldolase RhmA